MKRIIYLSIFVVSHFYSQAPISYNWINSTQGWVSASEANNGCQLFAQPESVAMRAYNETPIMRSGNLQANLGMDASTYNQVEITMKNPTTSNQNPTPNAILFVYPPESNDKICSWKFPVDTGMTEYVTYTIHLDSSPDDNDVFEGVVARFGLRAPWGVANFDTIYWQKMVVSNTNFVIDSVEINFKLDMSQVTGNFNIPEINGDFNNWCGNCDTMNDDNGDNIWEKAIKFFPGDTIEYKFSADNYYLIESLDSDDECTNENLNITNRVMIVPYSDDTLNFCWESCQPCLTSIPHNYFKIEIYPNPAKSMLHISSEKYIQKVLVKDVFGKTIFQDDPNNFNFNIDVHQFSNNIYFLQYLVDNEWFNFSFVVDK